MTGRSFVTMVGALVLAASTLVDFSAYARTAQAAQKPTLVEGRSADEDAEIRRKRDEAYRAGGLRAAATVTGSYRQIVSAHGGNNADTLEFLTKYSPIIIVGQILSNRTALNAPGTEITTDYEVFVEQSLRGHYMPAEKLTMSVVGGRIGFPDGSWAEVRVKDMLLPLNGERYVLFLRPTTHDPSPEQLKGAHGPILTPSFQSLSLYRLENGVVTPKAFPKHPLFVAYAGKPEQKLLDDIGRLLENPGGNAAR